MTFFQDETQVRRREKSAESRWSQNDDISVIQGFEFDPNDEASAKLQNHFPAPEIPKSWQPKFLRLKSSRFEPEKSDPKNLTPMERRAIVIQFYFPVWSKEFDIICDCGHLIFLLRSMFLFISVPTNRRSCYILTCLCLDTVWIDPVPFKKNVVLVELVNNSKYFRGYTGIFLKMAKKQK